MCRFFGFRQQDKKKKDNSFKSLVATFICLEGVVLGQTDAHIWRSKKRSFFFFVTSLTVLRKKNTSWYWCMWWGGFCPLLCLPAPSQALISPMAVRSGPQLWERKKKSSRGLTGRSPVDSRCWSRDLPIPGQHSCLSDPPGLCMHCLQPHHLELFVLLRSVQIEEHPKRFEHSSMTPQYHSSFD